MRGRAEEGILGVDGGGCFRGRVGRRGFRRRGEVGWFWGQGWVEVECRA